MKNKILFLEAVLGEDFLEEFSKSELYKPYSNVTIDPKEIWIAYQIVPRALLSWLVSNLRPVEVGDSFKSDIPGVKGRLELTKIDRDVYSGQIYSTVDQKKLYELKFRSLPSVGLCILSTFELYDNPERVDIKPSVSESVKLQKSIDERIQLNSLTKQVSDGKIDEKEAVEKLFMLKISQYYGASPEEEDDEKKKKAKLLSFLESKKNKQEIQIENKEDMECSLCGSQVYKSGDAFIECCVCYGEAFKKKIKFTKSERGIVFKFPKNFSAENIELILETIKNKRG